MYYAAMMFTKVPFISPSIKNENTHKKLHFPASCISCIITAFISVKTLSHMFLPICRREKVASRIKYKASRIHYTRANVKKKMERLEQENQELREGMTAMQAEMEKLTTLVSTLLAAQSPVSQTFDTVLESVTSSIPSLTVVTSISHAIIPEGFSWGMPQGFNENSHSTSITKPMPSGGFPWGMPQGFNENSHSTSTTKPMPSGGFPWCMPHGSNGDPRPFGSTSTTKPMPSGGFPWGMPHGFNEGFHSTVSEVPTLAFQ